MGFLDKIKGAVKAVTGGAARVTMEFTPPFGFAGEVVQVRISATSTGAEIKSKGVYVDLLGTEEVRLRADSSRGRAQDQTESKNTEHELQIAPAFVLAANETKHWEGHVTLPGGIQPSFAGAYATYTWQVRGRIEATGNDPDSGFKAFRVGLKS